VRANVSNSPNDSIRVVSFGYNVILYLNIKKKYPMIGINRNLQIFLT
jgi:hypothetical protein